MFSRLINYFIPAQVQQQEELLHPARIMVIVILLTGALNGLYIKNALALHFYPLEYVLLANALLSVLIAFLFRWGVPGLVCANLYSANQAVGIFAAIWLGGGMNAPSAPGVLLLPITTLLIAGPRSSLAWLLISLFFLYGVYQYELVNGPLPVRFDESMRVYFLFSGLMGMLVCLFVIALVFDREKTKAFETLTQKHTQLKNTQNQLIQSEKMASLGELTTGIAHEIQNPLNFVNNFAEVSGDLINELKEEQQKPTRNTELEAELLNDLQQNLKKISNHGNRASAIVTGMLEHSRTSTGERRPTNLNALTNEFLNLVYQGAWLKDKSLTVQLKTDFDPSLGKVEVAPQEIGRVLLNLFNNAFYAILEKQKTAPADYQPMVSVSTKRNNGTVQIRVQDNGTGIPDAVKPRIFQPFFTTKPSGEGTGLGLSLSYDIITNGHGGTLWVESVAGERTEFIINLPYANQAGS